MKKYFRVIVAVLLALITVISVGCSGCKGCGSQEENPSSSGEVSITFTDIKVTDAGRTDYVIVIPYDADECVSYAATELQKYFKESTTANIAIEKDEGKHFDSSVKYISLGNTVVKEEAGIADATKQEVNLDGFKMIRKDNCMFIVSYEPRGVLYGVYSFMRYTLGYESYAVDEIALNYETTVYMPDLNLTEAPSFEGRRIDGPITRYDNLAISLGFKQGYADEKYGGDYADEWLFRRSSHCEWGFFEEDGYLKHGDRPSVLTAEMKALNDQHLCWTNAEVIGMVVERAIRQLQKQPEALYVNFAEEDNAAYCTCSRASTSYCGMGCKESTETYGSSGTLIRFVNKIVEGIEAWREVNCPERDIKYCTLAYGSNITPPVKLNENGEIVARDESCIPHEKLYIKYAPLGRCCLHAFTDESCKLNENRASNWEGWKVLTDGRLMVYDYLANFHDYYTFFNNYNVVQEELIEYHEAGVVNYFSQHTSGANFSSMSDLNVFLYGKLIWNVYVDVNQLIEDFMYAYYKEGAPYMIEYFNLMRTHVDNKMASSSDFHATTYAGTHTPYYNTAETWPKAVLHKALSLIEQADKVYDEMEDAEMREKLKTRILKESFCVRYTLLNNYGSYYSYSSAEYDAFKAQWCADALTLSANYWGEGRTVADFINSLP